MKIKMLPNVLGYVFIKKVQVVKKNGLIFNDQKGRLEAKIGKVISDGLLNGELVLYHFALCKRYIFNNEELFCVRISDIIATVEVSECDNDVVDVIEIDSTKGMYDSGNDPHGEPSIMKI